MWEVDREIISWVALQFTLRPRLPSPRCLLVDGGYSAQYVSKTPLLRTNILWNEESRNCFEKTSKRANTHTQKCGRAELAGCSYKTTTLFTAAVSWFILRRLLPKRNSGKMGLFLSRHSQIMKSFFFPLETPLTS